MIWLFNFVIVSSRTELVACSEVLFRSSEIIFDLSKLGIWMTDIEVKKPTLEHVFLQIARGEKYVFE